MKSRSPSDVARAESQLSDMLKSRFDAFRKEEDLYQSNLYARRALSLLQPTHPNHVLMQHNLALGLWARFNLKVDRMALDESITLAESTVASSSLTSPYLPDFLHSVSVKRNSRYLLLGKLDDLNAAIERVELALQLGAQDHPQRAEWCSDLTISLESRFVALGNIADIDRAVELSMQAVQLEPSDDVWLSNLGSNLSACAR